MDLPKDRIINLSALQRRKKLLERDIVEFLRAKITEIERDFGVQARSVDVKIQTLAALDGVHVTIISDAAVDFDI